MKKVGDMKLYSFEGPILTILTNDKSIFSNQPIVNTFFI